MTEQKIIHYLETIGIKQPKQVVYNPSYERLFEDECSDDLSGYEKGHITNCDAVNVYTGVYTGRSPKDKYIVKDDTTRDTLWWSGAGHKNDNKPISAEVWNDLKAVVTDHLSGQKLYVVDGFCGANKNSCLRVRFIMEVAWQAHFVKNMFIRPSAEELVDFEPDFVVINGSKTSNPDWKRHGKNSETFVAFNLTENIQLIGGTWYGGEMK